MRRSLSILAAAVIAITGVASNAPAQAAMRAAPAVLDQAGQNADIVQVHRKRYRSNYRRYSQYRHHHRPQYVRRYYDYPYAYYPYRRYREPGFSIQFNLGGGRHGYY